jgi:hypothetical protein
MSHRAGKYSGDLAVGGVRISVSKERQQRSTHTARARQVKSVPSAQKSHVVEAVQQGVCIVGSWTKPRSWGSTTIFLLLWRQCLGLRTADAQECTHIVRARDVESVPFAEQDMFWKQSSTASGRLVCGRRHSSGVMQWCSRCRWCQSLGLQSTEARENVHTNKAHGMKGVPLADKTMFWKQSSREGVTEGLAGRRRGCMMVGDIVGKDRRKKRLSNQCPGSRPTVLETALAIDLSHAISDSYMPSLLSSFAKRKDSLRCSESLLQLLPEVDVSFVVVLERGPLLSCEMGCGHRVGGQRAPFLTAIRCR